MATGKYIAYLRVSTARQGASGLGIAAQRKAVEDFLNGGRHTLLRTFIETESGKVNARPQLEKALHLCKVTGATLIVAKLDRLSRNAAFLMMLRDSGARFVAADMPDANTMTIGILALVAQHEREAISKRTTEALQAAKARGVKLGSPDGARHLLKLKLGNKAAVKANRAKAADYAESLRPVIDDLRAEGVVTLPAIADALTERGMQTPRGGKWHPASVRNLLNRLGRQKR